VSGRVAATPDLKNKNGSLGCHFFARQVRLR
jgi:hypothetical protein